MSMMIVKWDFGLIFGFVIEKFVECPLVLRRSNRLDQSLRMRQVNNILDLRIFEEINLPRLSVDIFSVGLVTPLIVFQLNGCTVTTFNV
jgi:hypothetical protein